MSVINRTNSKTNNTFRSEITHSECLSDDGITISLIDTISFLANILSTRKLDSKAVKGAIEDFQSDENAWLGIQRIFVTDKDKKDRALIAKTADMIRKSKKRITV